MKKRKVAIKLPGTDAQVFEITSITFGELKNELKNVDFTGKDVIIRENKLTLQSNEAQLPLTDFTLFLFPSKNASGNDLTYVSEKELKLYSYNQLRSYGSKLNKTLNTNINLRGSKEDIYNNILDAISNSKNTNTSIDHSDKKSNMSDLKKEFEDAKEAITIIIDNLYDKISEVDNNVDNAVFLSTQQDIEKEFENLAKELKIKI